MREFYKKDEIIMAMEKSVSDNDPTLPVILITSSIILTNNSQKRINRQIKECIDGLDDLRKVFNKFGIQTLDDLKYQLLFYNNSLRPNPIDPIDPFDPFMP